MESMAEYPNLAIELESLAGCNPTADGDCNLKLLCTNSNMHIDNGQKCNEKELRKCILKILLSRISKGIGF